MNGMLLLSVNRQCQSTEGNAKHWSVRTSGLAAFCLHPHSFRTPDERGVAAFHRLSDGDGRI